MSTQETKLKAIADAIREKDGTTAPISANDFPARIRAIPVGGSLPENLRIISVQASDPEGGSVSGGGAASDGMTVTVKAEAGDRYKFTSWQEDGAMVSEDKVYTFVVARDRILVAMIEENRLPNGYTEVEFIQSSGTQYIQTDVTPVTKGNAIDTKIVMDVQPLTSSSSSAKDFFGSAFTYSSTALKIVSTFRLLRLSSETKVIVAASLSSISIPTDATTVIKATDDTSRRILIVDGPNKYAAVGNTSVQLKNNPAASSNFVPIALFGCYQSTSGSLKYALGIDMRLFSCQIEKAGVLVRDYVPCIDPTGAVGLYDLVEGKFYGNAGTGAFTAGPAV